MLTLSPVAIDVTALTTAVSDQDEPAPLATPLKVVVTAGRDEGKEAPLEPFLEVGTHPSCGLVITDPWVSKRHIAISASADRFIVKDLGSRNGTRSGNARVGEIELPIGSVIQIGRSELTVLPQWHVREIAPSTARCFGELDGESTAMRELFAVLERASLSEATLLIEGESGTGKELAARSVHAASARGEGPYVVFDCGAVPPELAESELFGHKRGAFSGATSDRAGAFQRADGGTICLDELGELPLDLQPKLLRVLETGEVRPVGSDTPRRVDVRVIASTNRDLFAESTRGRFRRDLYYRLEVLRARMPALRQRPEDIAGLVRRLLADKLPPNDVVEGKNLRKLLAYGWPGNVRELRNALARAVALAQPAPANRGLPSFDSLVFNLGNVGGAPSPPIQSTNARPAVTTEMPYKEAKELVLQDFEQVYVTSLLAKHRGNVTKAAAAAGLSRKHVHLLIRKTQFDVDLSHERSVG